MSVTVAMVGTPAVLHTKTAITERTGRSKAAPAAAKRCDMSSSAPVSCTIPTNR